MRWTWTWWFGVQVIFGVEAAILPPPWADPSVNPCANQPGGWLKLYWPADGQCYRIFQRGAPCPETMELSPGQSEAECRCPPGQVQLDDDSPCHQIHTKGPCKWGQHLAPIEETTRGRWGECLNVRNCPKAGELFWPMSRKCYPEYTRGPCPVGQLLAFNNDTGLAECGCESSGALSRYYWPPSKSCHQFYTRGPCLDKGALFLPGPQCGCHPGLPNYHLETEQCYELGGSGPCKTGHIFEISDETGLAHCACKSEHVPWFDGHCYRVYTQGPCPMGKFIIPSGVCQDLPCARGMLYFPEEDACFRLGVRGPCPGGQLVLYEQSVRTSIEGISYRGMCGCSATDTCNMVESENEARTNSLTEHKTKMSYLNHTTNMLCEMRDDREICHRIYTQGACKPGEWLVPLRQGRTKRRAAKIPSAVDVYIGHRFNTPSNILLKSQSQTNSQVSTDRNKEKQQGQCECRPGYTKMSNGEGCHLPLIELAKFLNGKDYFN